MICAVPHLDSRDCAEHGCSAGACRSRTGRGVAAELGREVLLEVAGPGEEGRAGGLHRDHGFGQRDRLRPVPSGRLHPRCRQPRRRARASGMPEPGAGTFQGDARSPVVVDGRLTPEKASLMSSYLAGLRSQVGPAPTRVPRPTPHWHQLTERERDAEISKLRGFLREFGPWWSAPWR